jgi:DNA-binding transcriptional LysR family regulator
VDRFRELETFVAVVEAGSFVKAAQTLRSSTTAVSRLVQDLETRLGGRLLQRTTRRLSLTEAGRDYWLRAKQILADLAEADGAASAVTGRVAGLLRVSAPVSFGVLHLAPLWGTFLAFHPEVALDVTLDDRLVDLVEDGGSTSLCALRRWPTPASSRAGSPARGWCSAPRRAIWPHMARPQTWPTWPTIG